MDASLKVAFANVIDKKKVYKNISFFEGQKPKDYTGADLIHQFNTLQYSIKNEDALKIIENFKNSIPEKKAEVNKTASVEETKNVTSGPKELEVPVENKEVVAQSEGAKSSVKTNTESKKA
mgnify:CR=1 FL=1